MSASRGIKLDSGLQALNRSNHLLRDTRYSRWYIRTEQGDSIEEDFQEEVLCRVKAETFCDRRPLLQL